MRINRGWFIPLLFVGIGLGALMKRGERKNRR